MRALVFAFFGLAPISVLAGDISCNGGVTMVMDYPEHCGGHVAFRTETSNHKWICSTSKNGDAIALAALAADKDLQVYIDSQNNSFDCSNLPNYVAARYIIVTP